MAQMERNVNLEEIDSDALFGIDALKGQTFLQKIIFFGCLGAGIVANVLMPMFLNTPRAVCILLFLLLIMIGIAFGCNYTPDLTYGRYVYHYFFKPKKILKYASTEDISVIRKRAAQLRKQEEAYLKREKEADPASQKKLLVKLIVFAAVVLVAVITALAATKAFKTENYHHEAVLEEDDGKR